ncbi:hypothetical protein WISP_03881 [Willisornis vidua]|uniref:Secreted protein n=1 Tax=Willisornis vidua TaxID=1566151 RepID=A0ABQ9DU59_9PASS|nr:hypothetical protein WISP_03881 [Willisornis vidua]
MGLVKKSLIHQANFRGVVLASHQWGLFLVQWSFLSMGGQTMGCPSQFHPAGELCTRSTVRRNDAPSALMGDKCELQ